jgi:hypothetical protein
MGDFWMNSKGQIFTVGMVVIGLSLFVIFAYFLTVQESSIVLFDKSSSTQLENFINAAGKRNDWLNETWRQADRQVRMYVNITWAGVAGPDFVIMDLSFSPCVGDCLGRVIVTNTSNDPVAYTILGSGSSGQIQMFETFDAGNLDREYIIYYNDSVMSITNVVPPALLIGQSSELFLPLDNLCRHSDTFYETVNVGFDCLAGLNSTASSELNYTISFRAPDLQYEGTISP